MSADCRNFLEMVLTNTVMEGETERHANAGGMYQMTASEKMSLNKVMS